LGCEITVPSDLVNPSSYKPRSLVVDLNDIDPLFSQRVASTEGPVIADESTPQRDEVFVFVTRNRVDCGEARLESGVPRFHFHHDDRLIGDRDDVRLKAFGAPITDEDDEAVFLEETARHALAPPTT
jgi:hypothetical protein